MARPPLQPSRPKAAWPLYVGLSVLYWYLVIYADGIFVVMTHCYVALPEEKAACYRDNYIADLAAFILGILGNWLLVRFLNRMRSRRVQDASGPP